LAKRDVVAFDRLLEVSELRFHLLALEGAPLARLWAEVARDCQEQLQISVLIRPQLVEDRLSVNATAPRDALEAQDRECHPRRVSQRAKEIVRIER
jgi:hypothetical protein